MAECETDFEFKLSGRVVGKTPQAINSISVLNLGDRESNNRSLIEKRKQLVQAILFTNGVDPSDGLEDNDLIEMLIDDVSTPSDGKLEAFAPIVANVLKQWIA